MWDEISVTDLRLFSRPLFPAIQSRDNKGDNDKDIKKRNETHDFSFFTKIIHRDLNLS